MQLQDITGAAAREDALGECGRMLSKATERGRGCRCWGAQRGGTRTSLRMVYWRKGGGLRPAADEGPCHWSDRRRRWKIAMQTRF